MISRARPRALRARQCSFGVCKAVRQASDPDALLLGFLQETYEAAAELAKWDRKALERMASTRGQTRSAV
jgi:hypothetical protein